TRRSCTKVSVVAIAVPPLLTISLPNLPRDPACRQCQSRHRREHGTTVADGLTFAHVPSIGTLTPRLKKAGGRSRKRGVPPPLADEGLERKEASSGGERRQHGDVC